MIQWSGLLTIRKTQISWTIFCQCFLNYLKHILHYLHIYVLHCLLIRSHVPLYNNGNKLILANIPAWPIYRLYYVLLKKVAKTLKNWHTFLYKRYVQSSRTCSLGNCCLLLLLSLCYKWSNIQQLCLIFCTFTQKSNENNVLLKSSCCYQYRFVWYWPPSFQGLDWTKF